MKNKSTRGDVLALVGAQYGSEGKGVVAAHLAKSYDIHVRTGGPNAGHTFIYNGEKVVMQSIPCGWVNPNSTVVIGAGGLVDLDILAAEYVLVKRLRPDFNLRFRIDANCGVISSWHQEEEGGVNGEMHQRIGSTGKGVGTARRDRLMRDPSRFVRIKDIVYGSAPGLEAYPFLSEVICEDAGKMVRGMVDAGATAMLEGTQGSGLSLIHGPWPYVTSNDTNTAQMCADAGIPTTYVNQICLVARTYPIRVAGNSGPMEKEITWDDISARMGRNTVEKTTVTKKTRRIAEWDEDLVRKAVALNDPTSIVLTFMDYLSPEDEGQTDWDKLSERSKAFIEYVETVFDVQVPMVGTGGPDFAICQRMWGYL